MSDNKGSGMGPIPGGTGRKRGHQHHIRNSGQRRSNVPADEVIAALRSGSDLLMTQTYHDDDEQSKRHSFIDDDDVIMIDIDNANTSITADSNANTRPILSVLTTNASSTMANNKSNNSGSTNSKPESQHKTKKTGSRCSDAETSHKSSTKSVPTATASDSSRKLVTSSALNDNNNNLQMDTPKEHLVLDKVGLGDSISSSNSSTNAPGTSITGKTKKSKTKREGGAKKSSKSSTTDSTKKEKRSKKVMPPNEERPPLEGAPASELYEQDIGDIENDPEAAEWSKLRCTSERTEVVAEREYRRQNRRCADYPGLAFGRSIFSSDTMMKLNIIRNELHNIMKTQLKRVGCDCGKKRNDSIQGK